MAPFPWLDAAIIAGLILLNGFFAMSELAIVSARRPRLRGLAERGSSGARTALALAEDAVGGIQGALVLARAADEPELFMRALARMEQRLNAA